MKNMGLWGKLYPNDMTQVMDIADKLNPNIIYAGSYHPIMPLVVEGYNVVIADHEILKWEYIAPIQDEYAKKATFLLNKDPFYRTKVGSRINHPLLNKLHDEFMENSITEVELDTTTKHLPEWEVPIAGDLVPSVGTYRSVHDIEYVISKSPIKTPMNIKIIYI
ncbi:hypothetical protein [Bacteroides sp.]|uniref:hypothetical protein n=1 Tax=Bacteroides sp. TaxID=29523 RepID=UPI002604CA05|nr:hypothetical protein [Bacteroides sp.]MDD3039053.1 hypothetical protein [Bacteroides sp.]